MEKLWKITSFSTFKKHVYAIETTLSHFPHIFPTNKQKIFFYKLLFLIILFTFQHFPHQYYKNKKNEKKALLSIRDEKR
jgi:UDP:flavonoid glycosyltransferase YjiC (YdhE family)